MHWTQELKIENARLRAALSIAREALLTIPQSRMDKERDFPHADPELGQVYTTCAREVMDRNRAALVRMDDAEMGAE